MPQDAPHPSSPSPTGAVGTSADEAGAEPRPRASRADPHLGKVLDGRYRLVSLLAKGGMGRVYRAEQAPFGRLVAVKVLDVGDERDDDQEFRARFVREAETCARLAHPNTVRVFEYGTTDDDVPWIAMELLVGRNLFQAIQTDAPMDPARVARIGRQIAASLREAHGLGLIHRDLKPSNIILTRPDDEEFVKVVDFGLVKEIRTDAETTRQDALVGSPGYMSPEQVRSDPLDERSDVYSLGVLLYACLCGRPPFQGPSLNVLLAHLNEPPPPMESVCPSMPRAPALEAVVRRCLAKAPEARYPDMGALLGALQEAEEAIARGDAGPTAAGARTAAGPSDAGPGAVPGAPARGSEGPGRVLLRGLVGLLAVGGGVAWAVLDEEERRGAPPTVEVSPTREDVTAASAGGGEAVLGVPTQDVRAMPAETPADARPGSRRSPPTGRSKPAPAPTP
ncbi:MAG: protein kinase domain-containing protein, partial [Myxococcota bacterium]